MPWYKVDDGLPSKIETTRIPRAHRTAAIGLWALAGAWCARELTDGFLPAHMVDELAGSDESAAWLVSAGFWSEVDGGFQFVVWDGEQPMREKVLEQRRKNAEKVQNWRARNAVSDAASNRVTAPVTNPVVTPPPARPDPSRPLLTKYSPPAAVSDIEASFDQVWASWPKRVERKRSLAAFVKAARKRPLEELAADISRFGAAYAATTERRFVPALSVWLTGERWTDDLPTPPPPTDAQWEALLAGRRPTRTEENMAVVARLAAQEVAEHRALASPASPGAPDDCGHHRWLADGTCMHCTARRDREAANA